jgi:hypothetical protein
MLAARRSHSGRAIVPAAGAPMIAMATERSPGLPAAGDPLAAEAIVDSGPTLMCLGANAVVSAGGCCVRAPGKADGGSWSAPGSNDAQS